MGCQRQGRVSSYFVEGTNSKKSTSILNLINNKKTESNNRYEEDSKS